MQRRADSLIKTARVDSATAAMEGVACVVAPPDDPQRLALLQAQLVVSLRLVRKQGQQMHLSEGNRRHVRRKSKTCQKEIEKTFCLEVSSLPPAAPALSVGVCAVASWASSAPMISSYEGGGADSGGKQAAVSWTAAKYFCRETFGRQAIKTLTWDNSRSALRAGVEVRGGMESLAEQWKQWRRKRCLQVLSLNPGLEDRGGRDQGGGQCGQMIRGQIVLQSEPRQDRIVLRSEARKRSFTDQLLREENHDQFSQICENSTSAMMAQLRNSLNGPPRGAAKGWRAAWRGGGDGTPALWISFGLLLILALVLGVLDGAVESRSRRSNGSGYRYRGRGMSYSDKIK
ncbi:unnamed protein product [Cyprideis torosa]|uniref:Uncharacterized protein n=1 Tax=Cyprideis torosa TaxID=163714 RepID=A0A7R8ZMT4_9CRUS|nr:unnamed protein product [Cyprideis torosa]CAG0889790.1 unnamed protein product [Cyprideis torosa]